MEQDHPFRNHHRIGGLDGDSDMEEREMTVSDFTRNEKTEYEFQRFLFRLSAHTDGFTDY